LDAARAAVAGGARAASAILGAARGVLDAEPLARVDYAELVDIDGLEPVGRLADAALLALAVFIGRTRLIDNAVLAVPPA
jgi:pantoate--beta-alanine ligase